jgi:hypothetical protein
MLWCEMKFKSSCQRSSFCRWERLVQRRFRVRVQIVLHQHDHLRIRKCLGQAFQGVRVIQFRSALCHPHIPIARQWFDPAEQVCCSKALVLVILAFDLTGFRIDWLQHITNQLAARTARQVPSCEQEGLLVQTNYWTCWIVRSFVNVQYVFHRTHERCVLFGRDAPLVFQVRRKFIFFRVRRTLSRAMVSTNSRLTSSSAIIRSVQSGSPFGVFEQAILMICASTRPSILTGWPLSLRDFRCSVVSSPCLQNFLRMCSTV